MSQCLHSWREDGFNNTAILINSDETTAFLFPRQLFEMAQVFLQLSKLYYYITRVYTYFTQQ